MYGYHLPALSRLCAGKRCHFSLLATSPPSPAHTTPSHHLYQHPHTTTCLTAPPFQPTPPRPLLLPTCPSHSLSLPRRRLFSTSPLTEPFAVSPAAPLAASRPHHLPPAPLIAPLDALAARSSISAISASTPSRRVAATRDVGGSFKCGAGRAGSARNKGGDGSAGAPCTLVLFVMRDGGIGYEGGGSWTGGGASCGGWVGGCASQSLVLHA